MMPLDLLIAAPVADLFGVRAWYVVGGAICIVSTVAACIVNVEHNQGSPA